jgi:hypothetical protein
MLHGHMSYGGTYDRGDLPHHMRHPMQPQFPLLTNGQVVWHLPTHLPCVKYNHVAAAAPSGLEFLHQWRILHAERAAILLFLYYFFWVKIVAANLVWTSSVDGTTIQVPDAEDEQAIVVPPGVGSGGKRVHPLPYIESNLPGKLFQVLRTAKLQFICLWAGASCCLLFILSVVIPGLEVVGGNRICLAGWLAYFISYLIQACCGLYLPTWLGADC